MRLNRTAQRRNAVKELAVTDTIRVYRQRIAAEEHQWVLRLTDGLARYQSSGGYDYRVVMTEEEMDILIAKVNHSAV